MSDPDEQPAPDFEAGPVSELDVSEVFTQIVEGFANEYAAGRTPNPCIVCNVLVKFGALMDYADHIGAQYVATGHHIRMGDHDGAPAIHRGRFHDRQRLPDTTRSTSAGVRCLIFTSDPLADAEPTTCLQIDTVMGWFLKFVRLKRSRMPIFT